VVLSGAALRFSHADDRNHFASGLTFDRGRTAFSQTVETGVFDADRGITQGTGEVVASRLQGRTQTWSVYATDTFKPLDALAISAVLRFNETRVRTRDEFNLVPPNLDGDHRYRKLNPALGMTVGGKAANVYASASQGNRAPSPIELGCADPNNPCSLPNAMQGDPFLKQVVTRTLEIGARGRSGGLQWKVALCDAVKRQCQPW
jgi:outer membrane receptor protein involved in Fe transport